MVAAMTGHPRRWHPAGSFVTMLGLALVSIQGPSDAATRVPDVLAVTSYKDGAAELTLVAIDGSWRKPLREDGLQGERAAWSPDGTRIAYTRLSTTGTPQIWTTDLEGGDLRQLTRESNNGMAMDPAWSPDGRTLAYVGQGGTMDRLRGTNRLRLVDVAGQNDRAVTTSETFSAFDPAWHPLGTRIAITGDDSTDTELGGIWVINADGSNLRPLVSDANVAYKEPAWSPDGTRLAFVATPKSQRIGHNAPAELTVSNQDGTGARVVARSNNDDTFMWAPNWTPDGNAIVFTSLDDRAGSSGEETVEIVNADGTGRRVLFKGTVLIRAAVAPAGIVEPGSAPTTSIGPSTRAAGRLLSSRPIDEPDSGAPGGATSESPTSESPTADQGAHPTLEVSPAESDRSDHHTIGVLTAIVLLVASGLSAALALRRRRRPSTGDAN
jgi:dipeptidyl aminopeptidase/acylaminoacyl peptidase